MKTPNEIATEVTEIYQPPTTEMSKAIAEGITAAYKEMHARLTELRAMPVVMREVGLAAIIFDLEEATGLR